jgi:hypothetical protein
MYITPKPIYRYSAIHNKIPMSLFKEIGKTTLFPEQKEQY